MKLEVTLPDGVIFHGLYRRGTGWGAILSCQPGFWPSKYVSTFKDLNPPTAPFHSCSIGSDNCASAQEAIDKAFEKLKLTMAYLDGITRTDPRPNRASPSTISPAVIAGVNLGELDL